MLEATGSPPMPTALDCLDLLASELRHRFIGQQPERAGPRRPFLFFRMCPGM